MELCRRRGGARRGAWRHCRQFGKAQTLAAYLYASDARLHCRSLVGEALASVRPTGAGAVCRGRHVIWFRDDFLRCNATQRCAQIISVRLSGWGWSLGYAGGLICLVVALFGLLKANAPPFGLAIAQGEHIRATNLLMAAWFALFSIPIFAFTPDQPATGVSLNQAVRTGIIGLSSSVRRIVRRPGIGRFLIAYMLYSNVTGAASPPRNFSADR